jgi:hypothetical protein
VMVPVASFPAAAAVVVSCVVAGEGSAPAAAVKNAVAQAIPRNVFISVLI